MNNLLTNTRGWGLLQSHQKEINRKSIKELFNEDKKRGTRMKIEADGIYFDYSKHRVTEQTLALLFELARE